MAEGQAAEQVAQDLEQEATQAGEGEGDWLLQFFNSATGQQPSTPSALAQIAPIPSLFADDYAFAKTALDELGRIRPVAQWSADDASRTITLTAPLDLQQRLKQIPREARNADDRYVLTGQTQRVADAIEQARQAKREDESWPAIHYLWPQHPISEWLRDRVLTHFGRHTAPVLHSPKLAEDERAIVMMGLVPNRKGQPLLVDWKVVVLRGELEVTLEPFDVFCARAGLTAGQLPNPAKSMDTASLQDDLRVAVVHMQAHVQQRQQVFASEMGARLESTLANLKRMQDKQIEQLELRLERQGGLENLRKGKRERRVGQIRRVFDEYEIWVRDSLQTEPHPYLQVLAAVCR
jgi:hypothetical protein